MIYANAQEWRTSASKRVCFFGMSGLGKTYLSNMLRNTGEWYHYSADYRIGTHYMGGAIIDNAKRAAMQVPLLRDLLRTDSIYIGSNIRFEDLSPLSTYLGKPGNVARGGLPCADYRARQAQHRIAEIGAMHDTEHFITRAQSLYEYPHFICDTSGSVCEIIDPSDPKDPVLTTIRKSCLPVWLKGTDTHRAELIRRFDAAPKPLYFDPSFLLHIWGQHLSETGHTADQVDPDAFIRWAYAKLLDHRQPRYEAMARYGVTLELAEITSIRDAQNFCDLIAQKLP